MTNKATFAQPTSPTSGIAPYGGMPRKKRRRKAKPPNPDQETGMDKLNLFIPITKVDAAKRLVYGVATAEQPDVTKEICDYATTKPLYQKWSEGFDKATGGKSLGNVRAMHGKVAAGKLTSINFNDDAKQIEVCAKIVDDAEWQKVEEGVYTGFSQGGRYVKRWKCDANEGHTRYTAEPVEVSLVDIPCLPSATFEVVKEDGSSELRKFKAAPTAEAPPITNEAVATHAAELAKAAGKEDKWADFLAQAREDLEKAPPATTAIKPEGQAAADAAAKAAADDGTEEQVWVHKRLPAQTFKTKAEMRTALAALDASEAEKAAGTKPPVDKVDQLAAELQKRGLIEKRTFTDEERKKLAETGMALKDGSFPIQTRADLVAAIADYEAAKNKTVAKRHIVRRAKALKAIEALPEGWVAKGAAELAKIDTPELKKAATIYSVSNLLGLLGSMELAEEGLEGETSYPNGACYPYGYYDAAGTKIAVPKELTDRFGTLLVEFGDCIADLLDALLAAMRGEEAEEAAKMAGPVLDLMKAGARHSKADQDLLQKIHEHAVSLGADCGEDGDAAEKLAKSASDIAIVKAELANVTAERDELKKSDNRLGELLKSIKADVATIASQPMPGGPARTHVVTKERDGMPPSVSPDTLATELAKLSPEDLTTALIKVSQQNGKTVTSFGR